MKKVGKNKIAIKYRQQQYHNVTLSNMSKVIKTSFSEQELIALVNEIYFNPVDEKQYQTMIEYTSTLNKRYFPIFNAENAWNYSAYKNFFEFYRNKFTAKLGNQKENEVRINKFATLYASYTFFPPNSKVPESIMVKSGINGIDENEQMFIDLMNKLQEIELFSRMNMSIELDKPLNQLLSKIHNIFCQRNGMAPEMFAGFLSRAKLEIDFSKEKSQNKTKGIK